MYASIEPLVPIPNFVHPQANRRWQLILRVGNIQVTETGKNTQKDLVTTYPLLFVKHTTVENILSGESITGTIIQGYVWP
jgi:hypothetical protein